MPAKKATTRKKTTKKTTKKSPARSKPKPVELDQGLVDQIILQLTTRGLDDQDIRRTLNKSKTPDQVELHLVEAQKSIARAALTDQDYEKGVAIAQLKSTIQTAIRNGDLTALIQARKELSKLLGLYPTGGVVAAKAGNQDQQSIVDQIEAHLRPLGIAPKEYPIEGVARIAADTIRQLQARGNG